MSFSEVELHEEFLESCIEGDIKHVLELAYYQSDLVQSLIKGEIPCVTEAGFPGQYQPGEYLHAATTARNAEIVAQLINLGADPNSGTEYGTPLQIACRNGALDIIRLLHTHGVELHPDEEDIWNSPIYIACEQKHDEVVQYILSVKPDILTHKSEEFADGCILFCLACANENLKTVKLLAEKGVDINALVRLKEGELSTALDEACKNEHENVIQYLLQQHAEVSAATVEQYYSILASFFNGMRQKFTRSSSLRGRESLAEIAKNYFTFTWSEKNLSAVHESWFTQNAENIHSIELVRNKISDLPEDFFASLPNLEELDLSMNHLTSLPNKCLNTCKLKRLSCCRNFLDSIPSEIFRNIHIQSIDFSKNKLKYLPPDESNDDFQQKSSTSWYDDYDQHWACTNLIILKLSDNQLVKLPTAIHGATKLEKMAISNNELISFVSPWNCPMEDLDISGNKLTSFDYNIEAYWTKTLRRLNLSANQIATISWNICHLENLSVLDMSKNELESLPPPHYWSVKCLSKLNLSHNKLSASCGPEGFADVMKSTVEIAMSFGKDPSFLSNCEIPAELFKNGLQSLDLSHNNLEMVPETICSLTALGELNLSNNPRLTRLPPELGKLRNIWNLRLENLKLQNIPEEIRDCRSSKKILAHLMGKLRKSVPFKRMKLMVVGLQGRGKTSLLATLQGRKVPSENVATVGISVEQWTLQPPKQPSKLSMFFSAPVQQNQEVVFSTWDLAGQHVYYSTHQCFLTSNTLYLVVWNVTHGQEGIDGLAPWLLNIQARAPKSQVIVVGTHLDRLPQLKRKERLTKLESDIFTKFGKKGFPQISGNVFISNLSGEGLGKLKEVIYKVTSKMQDSNLLEPMIGKKVPLSYLQLYDAVTTETARRNDNKEAPVLTAEEFLKLAKENPDNDILDFDELDHAARFLHDHGVLLHFNDPIRGLSNLYFIDPTWLCDMIALLVTVREKNPFIKSGYIKTTDVMSVLKDPRLPVEFIPQFLQIMERFEIALRLDEEKILIPSMLPREKPLFLMQNTQKFHWTSTGGKDRISKLVSLPRNQLATQKRVLVEYIIRNYHLNYVPAGFWSRLIARLIVAVHKWGMIFLDQESFDESSSEPSESSPTKGVKIDKSYSMMYWREGIIVNYQAGNFLVESFKDEIEDVHPCEGLSITVWSDFGDFSVMGFIVDQIDRLITEWYPGLEDLDEYGSMTVQRVIPCPTCVSSFRHERLSKYLEDGSKPPDLAHHFRNSEFVQQFSLSVCALAAVGHEYISCEKHPDEPVPLSHLVPDLLLTDLPASLLLDKFKLDFVPSEHNRLGGGGAGEVFRAMYRGQQIAIKRFHSTKQSSNFDGEFGSVANDSEESNPISKSATYIPLDQTIGDQLEDNKVVRVFWELRQEVAILCRLQNPFIIGFLGVCRIPLCFGLELAPKGGLFSIIDDIAHRRDLVSQECPNNPPIMDSVLGRKLTYKIALQVAHALLYLHESEIVYRDLKSDNVLVCTLDESAIVNVKLSDYGISCFATPQGVIGEGGTPGFQAPEVKIGCPYDEKVDMFSYAIWLHELITGQRPYREHRTSAEIRKAVNNGIRPSLKNANVDSKLPYIEALMQDCWLANPASRPTALQVTQRLEDPRFYCLRNSFPKQNDVVIEHVTCLFPLAKADHEDVFALSGETIEEESAWSLSGNKLLLWCGDGKNRKFMIIDNETGAIQNDLPNPGHRVLCAARVGQRIWLGTEGCQIEVFGRQWWQIPRILWSLSTRDAIMDLLVEDKKEPDAERVFAALANGTVLVFKKKVGKINPHRILQRAESQEESDQLLVMEKGEWEEPTTINLANGGRPAKSLVFVKGGEELWVASGNCIAIINATNLQLVEQIKVFTLQRYLINQLVTDGERLWSIDRRSATIYQWDVQTRQKTHKIDCDVPSDPTGLVIAQPITGRLFDEITDSPPLSPAANKKLTSFDSISEEGNVEESVFENAEERAETVSNLVISGGHVTEPANATLRFPDIGLFVAKNMRRAQPSFMFQRKNRKTTGRLRTRHVDFAAIKSRPRSIAVTDSNTRLGSMLLVGDTIWVGRSVGDILVINIQKPTNDSVVNSVSYEQPKRKEPFIFGEVLCQFSNELMKQTGLLKEVSLLKKAATNHVVAVFRTELDVMRKRLDSLDIMNRKKTSRQNFDQFRFLVFEAWSVKEFKQFSDEISSLHELEENY